MPRLAPALWLLRSLTGYRLYHLAGFLVAVAVALAGLGVAFFWLGEMANSVAGVAGILVVVLAYLYAAALTLASASLVVARLVFARLRRSFASSRAI